MAIVLIVTYRLFSCFYCMRLPNNFENSSKTNPLLSFVDLSNSERMQEKLRQSVKKHRSFSDLVFQGHIYLFETFPLNSMWEGEKAIEKGRKAYTYTICV
jgi:hypothetical protein